MSEDKRDFKVFALSDHRQIDACVWGIGIELIQEWCFLAYRLPVYGYDDISLLDTGYGRRQICEDILDIHTIFYRQLQLFLDVRGDIHIGDTYQRPHDLIILLDGFDAGIHEFPRDRQSESDPLGHIADSGIDTYDITIDIQERPAAIACIDRCIRLEESDI